MKKIVLVLLLFVSTPAIGERVFRLGDDALVTLYSCCREEGKDHNSEVHIQLGEYSISSSTASYANEIYIVLDPFEPLGMPCGADGHLDSKLFRQISESISSELSVADFETFAFFTTEATTVGFITTSTGSAGTFPVYHFYDLRTKQFLSFWPSCDGETHWIDTVPRPPVIGLIIEKYWFFPYPHDDTYPMRVSLVDKVWARGQVLSDDDPQTRQILEQQYRKALSVWNVSVIEELGTLVSGSRQSAVTTDPWKYQKPLAKLMKYLFYAKRTGRLEEAKKVVASLHREIREAITVHEPDWYQIINPYRH